MRIREGKVTLTTFEDGLGNKLQVDKYGSFIVFTIGGKSFNVDEPLMSELIALTKKTFKTM